MELAEQSPTSSAADVNKLSCAIHPIPKSLQEQLPCSPHDAFHISTPWRDPDGLRRANVDNIKLERGHGRDPSSVALISIQSVRQFMA